MSQWRDRLGPWLLPFIAAAALASSAGAQYDLMIRFGWPWWQAALLPTCVDLVALYGVYLWLSNAKGGEAWRFGRKVAYAALIVSLVGNWTEHGLGAPEGWYWIGGTLGGTIPPIALFVMVHAFFKVRTTRPKPKPEPTPVPAPAVPSPRAARNPTPVRTVDRTTPTARRKRIPNPDPAALEWFIATTAASGGAMPARRVYMEEAAARGWSRNTLHFQAIRTTALAGQNGHAE